jgi:hypothetical protein
MTAASISRPAAKARLVRTGSTDRVVLRGHLRRALKKAEKEGAGLGNRNLTERY